ncbi:MAG: hypothetical protein C5B56_13945 [Proteobacteria bacterium]|nr:MAG: hypothetical protein C5B56_13945 [Pseudomonadota bacterium]
MSRRCGSIRVLPLHMSIEHRAARALVIRTAAFIPVAVRAPVFVRPGGRALDRCSTEMTEVCANLLGGIARSMKPNAKWSMELLDEKKKPVFRISIVGETVVQ